MIGENGYKLLRSENLDAASGAKRSRYDIEVAANASDDEVFEILKQAINDLKKKRSVDALAVRAYLEETERPYAIAILAPNGDWSQAAKGMPESSFKVSIDIYKENRPKESSNLEKFGLSIEQRKQVYREISKSQDKTREIAENKFPTDIDKKVDYMRALDEIYEEKIANKYGLTDKQLKSILGEGVSNNWPD